jgi:shikimate kinase
VIIFLVGVACVGKSTIGAALSQRLGYTFYDFDIELERFYGKPISRLKTEWITDTVFRKKAVVVLKKIIEDSQGHNAVVALPPSGLKSPYYRHIKASGGTVLWILEW